MCRCDHSYTYFSNNTGGIAGEPINRQRPGACSIRRGCQVIDLPRSTFYYRSTAVGEDLGDTRLAELIGSIQDEVPGYGYRRATHELRRRGHVVNHKRVARVMRAQGLSIKLRGRFVRTTDSRHDSPIFPNLYRNVIPTQPNVVWVADFTYIRIASGFAIWRRFWALVAARCWATRSRATLTQRWPWPWPRRDLQCRTDSLRLAASFTRTGDRNMQVKPIAGPCRKRGCAGR